MFKNIFTKTLYEKRFTMLLWGIGMAAMALLMMGFYHSFSGGNFDEALANLPKSVQGLVGNVASLKTVGGYVSQQVFALRIPLLGIIMGSVLFSGLIAGDEGDGTLQTLLAQPVSRFQLFIQKLLAGLVVSLVVCFGAIIGVVLGLALVHEQMSLLRLIQAVIGVWLLIVMLGSVTFSIGAITGKKGLAGSAGGMFAFVTYLLTSFAPSVSGLEKVEKFSPFHYYNNPSIAEHGLAGSNILVMLGVVAVVLTISGFIFIKRDIYQR